MELEKARKKVKNGSVKLEEVREKLKKNSREQYKIKIGQWQQLSESVLPLLLAGTPSGS